MKKIVSVISGLLFGLLIVNCFLLPVTTARASVLDELKQQIQEREAEIKRLEEQAKQYQASLQTTKQEKSTLQGQLNIIDSRIRKLQGDINLTSSRISTTNLQIEQLDLEIYKKTKEIASQKENVSGIIRTIYENDEKSFLEFLLENEKFSDFLNKVEYIELIQKSAQRDIELLKELKATLNDQKTEAEKKESSLKSYNNQLYSQRQVESSQKAAKDDLMTQTKGQEARYQSLLTEVEKKQKLIKEEIFRIEEKLRLTLDPASVPKAHSGVLSWPTEGLLTQGYGYTPYSKRLYKSGFHNGIDVAAGYGAPIRAARDGIVKMIGDTDKYCPRGAYGKMIVLEHDNNLTTLYTHLSGIVVSQAGQSVKRGQIIGYEGSTGYSTGSHLHFGVYATNTFILRQSNYCGLLPVGATINPFDYL